MKVSILQTAVNSCSDFERGMWTSFLTFSQKKKKRGGYLSLWWISLLKASWIDLPLLPTLEIFSNTTVTESVSISEDI